MRNAMNEFSNLAFNSLGNIIKIKKSSIIKNVVFVSHLVGGELVTIKLDPPRNLKVNNSKMKTKRRRR